MYQAKKRGWRIWLMPLLVAAGVLWLVNALGNMLTPFFVAAVLAYILNPLVEKLRTKGMKRGPASMMVMVFALLLLLALILIIVPMLINQFHKIVMRLPQLLSFTENRLLPYLEPYLGGDISLDAASIQAWLQEHTATLQGAAQRVVVTLMEQSSNVALAVTNMLLLPFLLYYFLLDWQRWSDGIRTMVPRRYLDDYLRISGNMDRVLSEFLRGQLTVMLIMGVIYGAGLMLVGLDSGFAIGIVAGILVFIPYLGAFTGLFLATLAGVLQFGSGQGLLMVWLVFGVGQFVESFFITPKIVGERIGLSPFWVIFALMAFGQLFGFVGMLIGLPLAAVTLVLLREGAGAYFNSLFYRRN